MHTHLPQAPDPQKMPQQKEHLENRKFFGEWWGLMSILNLMDAFLLPPCMLQDISLSARLIGFAGPTEKNSGRARQCIEFVGGETIWPYYFYKLNCFGGFIYKVPWVLNTLMHVLKVHNPFRQNSFWYPKMIN